MKKIDEHIGKVTNALKSVNRYTQALDVQIYSLASALRALELANADLDKLDSTTVKTPQGFVAHPVFKIRKDAEDSVTKQMKALGLTAEDLVGGDENDPLIELTQQVMEAGRLKRKTVRPSKK